MADGSIEFKTDLDNADLEKKLKQAEKSVESLNRKIEGERDKQSFIERAMERSRQSISETEAGIEALKAKMAGIRSQMASGEISEGMGNAQLKGYQTVLDEAEAKLKGQNDELGKLQEQWQRSHDKVDVYKEKLKSVEATEQALGAQAQAAAAKSHGAFSRAAESIRARMSQAAESAAAPWERFGRRINTMLRKVFVFGVILAGLRAVKSAISDMLGENELFNASVENLKATMGGFLSSIVGAVLPVLTQLVNALAAIFQRLAGFIDSVFGTNIAGAIAQNKSNASAAIQARNAEALAGATGDQAKSARKLAKEQERANRQIMSFDELNMLAAESSEDASDAMGDYASAAAAPELAEDWTQAGFGDLGVFQKVVDWLDMIRDRIANDFDGPFARIREGIGLIKQGWGELVRGIQAGDWALAWRGVQDIVVGVLYAIEGSVGAFLDWLDALTGGRFHEMFEGLKTTMHGIVEFTEGVLRGDWALALQGLSDMVGGVLDTVEGLFDGFVNWLDELTGGHFHEVFEAMETLVGDTFDGIQETFDGLLKFIDGVFKGDLDKALEGVRQIISGAANTVKGIVNGLGDTVKSIVNGVFNWLRDTFPQITPLLNFIERAISGTIDGVLALVNGAINMIQRIVGGAIDFIVGLITGDSGKIIGGLRGIVNGLIDALNGALRGVEGFVNWVTGGISDVLNWLIPNGGWSFSITLPRIPYLAQGAVIPPNREFLAVLGDQRRGNNIEAPESLMRQVVAEETGRQVAALMASMQSLQGGDVTLVLRVGNEELARATSKGNAMLARRGLLSAELVV